MNRVWSRDSMGLKAKMYRILVENMKNNEENFSLTFPSKIDRPGDSNQGMVVSLTHQIQGY